MFFKQRAANRNSLEQERRAREQEAIAATVNKFLQDDLLVHGDPESFSEEKPEPDLKVRTVLDRASEKIEGQFSGQPLVEAGLRFTLARAYRGLGEYATQERHVRRAYDIYLQLLGPGNLETLRAARELGDAERQLGRTNEVLALLQRTLEQAKRVLGPHHTDTLYSMAALAAAYEQAGQTNAGLDLIQEAVRLANDQHGPETKLASDLLEILAGMQSVQGKWPEAIENFQRTLELKRRLFGAGGLRVARV
jgi:non-specific serine/threonine protein kinase/serine/threonine-protein kinase